MFKSEVLPAPFGPMTEAMSPCRTSSDTSSTARTPPKRFDTWLTASWISPGDRLADGVVDAGAMSRASLSLMHRGYGWHDAGAPSRMQPIAKRAALMGALAPLAGCPHIVKPSAAKTG